MLVPYKQTYMESLFTRRLLIPIDGGLYDLHRHTLYNRVGLMKVYLSYGVLGRLFKMELSIECVGQECGHLEFMVTSTALKYNFFSMQHTLSSWWSWVLQHKEDAWKNEPILYKFLVVTQTITKVSILATATTSKQIYMILLKTLFRCQISTCALFYFKSKNPKSIFNLNLSTIHLHMVLWLSNVHHPCTGFAFKLGFATFMDTANLKQLLT